MTLRENRKSSLKEIILDGNCNCLKLLLQYGNCSNSFLFWRFFSLNSFELNCQSAKHLFQTFQPETNLSVYVKAFSDFCCWSEFPCLLSHWPKETNLERRGSRSHNSITMANGNGLGCTGCDENAFCLMERAKWKLLTWQKNVPQQKAKRQKECNLVSA